MLYYDRIDFSKGIRINKAIASKEGDICHYWCFLNKGCKFQPYVCNKCHDLFMYMNLSNIAILNIKASDCCCIISRISNSEARNLLQNIHLTEKVEHYKN